MNDLKNFKEKEINSYISNLMLNEDNIDINQIKTELGNKLGEQPGVELNYKMETLVMEDGRKSVRKEKIDSITVYYTYEDAEDKLRFGKLTYLTD